MNSRQINGLAVISIADGKKLGSVDHVYFDAEAKRVVGFSVGSGGGLLNADGESVGIVDAANVHSLGPDALTLTDTSTMRGDITESAYGSLIGIDDLTKRKVVTEGGTLVGDVVSLDFNEHTFDLTQIEVSPGFFKSNRTVPAHQVTNLGGDLVIVADAVCEEAPEGDVAEGGRRRWVVGDIESRRSEEHRAGA